VIVVDDLLEQTQCGGHIVVGDATCDRLPAHKRKGAILVRAYARITLDIGHLITKLKYLRKYVVPGRNLIGTGREPPIVIEQKVKIV
jgi:hypothetical protein